jgi:hypothetical protein
MVLLYLAYATVLFNQPENLIADLQKGRPKGTVTMQQVSYSLLQSVQSPIQWALGALPQVWGGRPAKLTVPLYRVPELKTSRITPTTSLVPSWHVHSYI